MKQLSCRHYRKVRFLRSIVAKCSRQGPGTSAVPPIPLLSLSPPVLHSLFDRLSLTQQVKSQQVETSVDPFSNRSFLFLTLYSPPPFPAPSFDPPSSAYKLRRSTALSAFQSAHLYSVSSSLEETLSISPRLKSNSPVKHTLPLQPYSHKWPISSNSVSLVQCLKSLGKQSGLSPSIEATREPTDESHINRTPSFPIFSCIAFARFSIYRSIYG